MGNRSSKNTVYQEPNDISELSHNSNENIDRLIKHNCKVIKKYINDHAGERKRIAKFSMKPIKCEHTETSFCESCHTLNEHILASISNMLKIKGYKISTSSYTLSKYYDGPTYYDVQVSW